jgi:hypothetical protein
MNPNTFRPEGGVGLGDGEGKPPLAHALLLALTEFYVCIMYSMNPFLFRPEGGVGLGEGEGKPPLAHALLLALADLLFCPEFTVSGGGHKVRRHK